MNDIYTFFNIEDHDNEHILIRICLIHIQKSPEIFVLLLNIYIPIF